MISPRAFRAKNGSASWICRREKNRATYENYAPGSIFKTVVSLAALENGLNPAEVYHVEKNPENPAKGMIYVGRRRIKDTAPPGDYDFKRAFIHSSNSYFINAGLEHAAVENIIRIGEEFHLGERTGLFARQETGGDFPDAKRVAANWTDGDTANLCIGQGAIAVTPIQMAVMDIGDRQWRQGALAATRGSHRTAGHTDRATRRLIFRPAWCGMNSKCIRAAATVAGRNARRRREQRRHWTTAAVDGLQICGKTGTAEGAGRTQPDHRPEFLVCIVCTL